MPRHENICGSGGIAPAFLTSVLDEGEWSASPQQGKSPLYPLDKRLGGLQSQSGPWGVQASLAPACNLTSGCPAPSSLPYRLSCPFSYCNITYQTYLWRFNINRPGCRLRIRHLSRPFWTQKFKNIIFFPLLFLYDVDLGSPVDPNFRSSPKRTVSSNIVTYTKSILCRSNDIEGYDEFYLALIGLL
jgi:hypothetical protein